MAAAIVGYCEASSREPLKKRLIFGFAIGVALLVAGVTVLAPAFTPLLASAESNAAGSVNITLQFEWIRQGRVGIVRVSGPDIADVRAVFQERVFYFYPENNAWVGLISADINYLVETYTMQVFVQHANGESELIEQPLRVEDGQFGRSDVTIPASLFPLLEPEVEEAEMDRLFNIFQRFTPQRYWEAHGFVRPSEGPEIGWFGTYRLYNETYWRRHTGIDVRVPVGTPILAMGDGRVVLAEDLAIRGGYVLIDHGWGVYSGYAHLSEKLVVPGQWVRQGDVIALSGRNGRSAGAHLHYEMTSGGAWVDPEDFMALINADD